MRERPFFAVLGAVVITLAMYLIVAVVPPPGWSVVRLVSFSVVTMATLYGGYWGFGIALFLVPFVFYFRPDEIRSEYSFLFAGSLILAGTGVSMLRAFHQANRHEREKQQRELARLARKQEEQLVHSTRLAEMGEMAAGVAHELNQPLTGIKNFARNATFMLEEDPRNVDEVKENLHLIAAQVDRASRIISQMRELAKKTDRQLGLVDLNAVLRESVDFVMPQLRLTDITVHMNLDSRLPHTVCDRIRIEQVFLNLLTNARHAMEESPQRKLDVRTHYAESDERPILIEIRDTGKGFAPGVAEKLFTPFFSTKQAPRGTGLGLSISLTIVKDHHGTIEATGIENQGATFVIRLPIAQASQPEESPRP